MKAGKRILAMVLLVLAVAGLLPMKAEAIDLIDQTKDVSLTIYCHDGETVLPDATFRLYQVAKITGIYCELEPVNGFDGLGATSDKINVVKPDWPGLKDTLLDALAKLPADQLEVKLTAVQKTGPDGRARFTTDKNGKKLEQGLYLVVGETHDHEEDRYIENPFLVMLPNRPLLENDGTENTEKWDYNVYVDDGKHERQDIDTVIVYKKWIMHNHYDARPKNITIHLYGKNSAGEVKAHYTAELNSGNAWSYTWTGLDDTLAWSVKEDPLYHFKPPVITEVTPSSPKAIRKFVVYVTNEYIESPKELPQTGLLWWPVPVLLSAGLLLVLVAIIRRRGEKREA